MHNAECWSSMPICIRLMTMCLVFAVRDIVEYHSIGCEQRFETRLCTPQMYYCPHVTKDTPLKITFNVGPSHFCVIFHVVEKACIKHRHLGHGPAPSVVLRIKTIWAFGNISHNAPIILLVNSSIFIPRSV